MVVIKRMFFAGVGGGSFGLEDELASVRNKQGEKYTLIAVDTLPGSRNREVLELRLIEQP